MRERLDLRATNVGSVHYMAPEQIVGDPLDERTDLYALGSIVFEICAGRTPFEGLRRDVLDRRLHRPAPRLSEVATGIPAELDALVARLLATAPEQRPLAAHDVADVLERLLLGEPIAEKAGGAESLQRPPFVGRGDELRQVMATVSAARQGAGGCVLVGGQSGIGKTRLGVALARQARTLGFGVVGGQCRPLSLIDGGVHARMLHPFVPLLGAMLDRSRGEPDSRLAAAVAEHATTMAMFDTRYREAATDPERQATSAAEVFVALRGLLQAYAHSAPLLVVLDDLQWADEMSMEALEFLVNSRFDWHRVVFVCMYRTEEQDQRIAELLAHPTVRSVVLRPLDNRAIAQVIAGMLAVEIAPRDLLAHVSRHAEGNPFFVAEYLRTAFDEGMLSRPDPRRWNVTGDLRRVRASAETSELPLPPNIVALVQRRLRGLADDATALVRVAAVIGRSSEMRLLRAVSDLPQGRFEAIVGELEQRQVVQIDGALVRFVHDKIREAAYQDTDDARRVELHGSVANGLEADDFADRAGRDHDLAHHWQQAGRPARAANYLGRAAQAAFDAGAFSDALNLLDRQLTLATKDGADPGRVVLVRLHRLRAGATLALGRVDECDRAVHETMRAAGHPLPASPAAWRRSAIDQAVGLAVQWLSGERIRWGRESLEPVARDVALALGYASEVHYNGNDAIAMTATILIAINLLIRGGRQEELARPWGRLAYLLGQVGMPGAARRYFDRAQRVASATGATIDGAFCATIEANYLLGIGRFDDAVERCDDALETLATSPDPYGEAIARTVAGIAHHLAGRHDDALRSYQAVFADADDRGAVQHRGWGIIGRVSAHVGNGDYQAATHVLDEERAFFDERIDLGSRVVFHGHAADVALRMGDLDTARREAGTIHALTNKEFIAQVTMIYGFAPLVEVGGTLLEHDPDEARRLLDRAVARLTSYVRRFPVGAPVLVRARAFAARAAGRHAAADRLFARSATLSDAFALAYDGRHMRRLAQPDDQASAPV